MSAADKLRVLDEEAARGPWTRHPDNGERGITTILLAEAQQETYWRDYVFTSSTDSGQARVDADLMVALRNALPELISVVEAAEYAVSVKNGNLDLWRGHGAVTEALTALTAKLGEPA